MLRSLSAVLLSSWRSLYWSIHLSTFMERFFSWVENFDNISSVLPSGSTPNILLTVTSARTTVAPDINDTDIRKVDMEELRFVVIIGSYKSIRRSRFYQTLKTRVVHRCSSEFWTFLAKLWSPQSRYWKPFWIENGVSRWRGGINVATLIYLPL